MLNQNFQKLNESFSLISLTDNQKAKLMFKKDIRYNIWAQMNPKLAYEYFYKDFNGQQIVLQTYKAVGFLDFLLHKLSLT